MFSREKFNALSETEKDILGMSIGYPDYSNDDNLYKELNTLWGELDLDDDPKAYITIVSKLL